MYVQDCARCGERLPLDYFAYDVRKVNGRTKRTRAAVCKLCGLRHKRDSIRQELLSVELSIQGAEAQRAQHQARVRADRERQKSIGLL